MRWHEHGMPGNLSPAEVIGNTIRDSRLRVNIDREQLGRELLKAIEEGEITPLESWRWLAQRLEIDPEQKTRINQLLGVKPGSPNIDSLDLSLISSTKHPVPVRRDISELLRNIADQIESIRTNSPRA